MKRTGVVRRIDELGRIVIPKEIRKTLRMKEGESLEIFLDHEEDIVLKKYSSMHSLSDFAQKFADSMGRYIKHTIVITDTDKVLASSGERKKKYLNKNISEALLKSIQRREEILENYEKEFEIVEENKEEGTYAMSTIIVNGDVIGSILLISDGEDLKESDFQFIKIASSFFEKYLEE